METNIEKLNRIFDKYKNRTNGNFHTFLWEFLVNDNRKGKECALTYLHNGGQIGLADKGINGYTPVIFGFNAEVKEKERTEIIDDLNKELFAILPKKAMEIVLSTMGRN